MGSLSIVRLFGLEGFRVLNGMSGPDFGVQGFGP